MSSYRISLSSCYVLYESRNMSSSDARNGNVYRAGYCVIPEPPMLHRALSEPSLAPLASMDDNSGTWTMQSTPPMVADNSHSNIQQLGSAKNPLHAISSQYLCLFRFLSSLHLHPHSWLNQHSPLKLLLALEKIIPI